MADPKSPYSVMEQNDRALAAGATSLAAANREKAGDGAFNVFRYPSDLGSDQHPHYLMFFITVRESDISPSEVRADPAVQFVFSQNNSGVDKSTTSATGFGVAAGIRGGLQAGQSIGT